MNRAGRIHARVELDFTEGAFVARYILLKKSKEGLRLLRAKINALKISNLYLSLALLLQGPKDHEEIPDIHSHLHAIGVGFAVVRSTAELDVRLWRNTHGRKCNDFQGWKEVAACRNLFSARKPHNPSTSARCYPIKVWQQCDKKCHCADRFPASGSRRRCRERSWTLATLLKPKAL
jgi:hypothetical protein